MSKVIDDELRQLVTDLAKSQVKTDAQLARTDAQFEKSKAEADERGRKLDELLEKTIKKLDDIGRQLGDMGVIQGQTAEEAIYRSIHNTFRKRGKIFDDIKRNVKVKGVAEYDIIAVNGSEVLTVEVKNKLTKADVDKFLLKQLPKFKQVFPKYADYKLLAGVGGLVVQDSVESYAKKQGLYVFVQSADGNVELCNKKNFKAKVFG